MNAQSLGMLGSNDIEILSSFVEGEYASRPIVVPLSREVETYCNRWDIHQYLDVASDILNKHFSNIRSVTSEVLHDPETGDQLLIIHLEVTGEAEYPQLTRDDIRAAIAYGAEMSRERYVDIPAEAAG